MEQGTKLIGSLFALIGADLNLLESILPVIRMELFQERVLSSAVIRLGSTPIRCALVASTFLIDSSISAVYIVRSPPISQSLGCCTVPSFPRWAFP